MVVGHAVAICIDGRIVDLTVTVGIGEDADARSRGGPAARPRHRAGDRRHRLAVGGAPGRVDVVRVVPDDDVVALQHALLALEVEVVLVLLEDVEQGVVAVEDDRDAGDQHLRVGRRRVVARDDAVRDARALIDGVVGRLRLAERRERGDVGALEAVRVRPRLRVAAGIGDRAHRAGDVVGAVVEQRVVNLKARRAGLEDVRRRAVDAVVDVRIDVGRDRQQPDALDVDEVVVAALADRADDGGAALAAVAHDVDLVRLARAAEQVDEAELAEVIVDGLVRAVGEHRVDEVAALRDHADHARRRLDDERRLVVLDEEVADHAALRGAGDELARIGDLPCEHLLSAAGLGR